jgi:hypothetical protein
MHPVSWSRRRSIRTIRSSSRLRQRADSRDQSALVGVRFSGRAASASRISSRETPTCWAIRMKPTRRSSLRWYRRWLPLVRVDRISPSRS